MSYSGKFKDKDNNLHPVTSVLYGTCDTAAATAAKVVTCTDFDRLMTGVTIRVKFTYGNTAASPTVNINNTGATAVYCYGSTAPVGGTSWQAGAVVELVYDGTSFFIVGSATSGSDDIVAAEFSTATTYAAGDYCIYDGGLYKFKTSHTGAWAAADVDSITVTGELKGKQDIFERISYADWQLLTPQQQAAKPYYIYDYPSTQITAANVSYDHTQSGLSATTAQGGIDELASEKQDATDNNLTTTNKTIVGGINEIKSGLTNLQNDVEGAWEELTFADVVTLSQDVTTTGTPKAYRRGNRIRLHFDVTGTLTMSAGGSKTIGTLKTAYKPTRFNYLPTLANKASSGIVMYPFNYVISSNTGNINLIAGTGELGNANNSWMGNDSVEIVYELS